MKNTYTTASGLQIGCMYQSTVKPYHDADALRIQKALTDSKDPIDREGITIILVISVVLALAIIGTWLGGVL